MDTKKFLTESSLVLVILFVFVYSCGISYFHSILHGYDLGIFFTVSWQPVIGEGLSTLLVFLFPSILIALCASGARRVFEAKNKRPVKYISLFTAFSIAIGFGLAITHLGRMGGRPILDTSQLWPLRWIAVVAFLFVSLLAFLHAQQKSNDKHVTWLAKPRIVLFIAILTLLIMLIAAGYYSNFLGKDVVRQIDYRRRAKIVFSEESLEKAFGDSWFVPILEQDDEIIFVKYSGAERPPVLPGRLVFIKKTAITSIDYSH